MQGRSLRGFVCCSVFIVVISAVQIRASEFIETFEGDMPLLIPVDHGGWKIVGSVQVGPAMSDTALREYVFQTLLPQFFWKTGHLPYYISLQGRRDYVNTNRYVGDPEAYGSPEAEAVYQEYHGLVDSYIGIIETRWGADSGLLLNPHTTNLPQSLNSGPWDRIAEIGISTGVEYLDSPGNTMRALYARKGAAAITGAESVPYMFYHGNRWPDPDAVWPLAATINSKTLARLDLDVWHVLPAFVDDGTGWVDPYYRGEATIEYHGTNSIDHYITWLNGLDAFQVEFNVLPESGLLLNTTDPEYDPAGPENQIDPNFAWDCADNFTDAVLNCLRVSYDWSPGAVYTVIVDNGTDGCTTTGLWLDSTALGFWGPNSSAYTGTAGDSARWTPDLQVAGTYDVSVRWTRGGTRTSNALYTVRHTGGETSQVIDQNGSFDARWTSLGQFQFAAGESGFVTLTAQDGYPTCADAVMFRLVAGTVPANRAPTAMVTVHSGEPRGNGRVGIGDTVELDASRSLDSDGMITGWQWDFGDGTQGTGEHVTHIFSSPGTYTVRLTVTDDDGEPDTESVPVTVLPRTYRIDNGREGFSAAEPGSWSVSGAPGYYGTQGIETFIAGTTATWNCRLGETGQYQVFVRWSGDYSRTTGALYTVLHGSGQTGMVFDQTTNGGQWVLHGTYSYPGNFDASVTLTAQSASDSTCADAVQWVRVPQVPSHRLHFTFERLRNNRVLDDSEYGMEGLSFGPAPVTGGVAGHAMHFDGTDDYIVVDSPMVSDFPFTMATWVRTTLPDSENRRIMEIANRSGQSSVYSVFISYGDPCIGAVSPTTPWVNSSSYVNINDGDWHHVAAVFAGDTDKRLYVDGTLRTTLSDTVPFSSEVDSLTLGRDGDSNPNPLRFFEGDLDEVHVYDRALTQNEIQTLAQTPTPTPTPSRTPTPTRTPTSTRTPTRTPTGLATSTPTRTPTSTPSNTPTHTPSNTPSVPPTGTPTSTPTNTPTDTPSHTPGNTPTHTMTPMPTATPTAEPPTGTPTLTPTSGATSVPTATPTQTPTPAPPTWTPAETATQTPVCVNHGDVNASGDLTAADAQMAFGIVLGTIVPTFQQECAADCDGSGSVTAGDAQMIFLAVLGFGTCNDPIP